MQQGELREAMSRVDQPIAALARGGEAIPVDRVDELSAAWKALVKIMAVPSEPQVRNCPACHKAVMSTATLCGFCWSPLLPEAGESR